MDYYIFFVKVPNIDEGTKIANILVESRLVACVNIIQKIFSIYRWKGQIEEEKEIIIIAKTTDENVRKICEFLEINFEPEMVNYFYFEHHPLGGNTGTLSLIPKAQQKDNSSIIKLTNRNEYYYSKHPLNIKLDLRWKRELKSEYLQLFESLVGELNNDFRMD